MAETDYAAIRGAAVMVEGLLTEVRLPSLGKPEKKDLLCAKSAQPSASIVARLVKTRSSHRAVALGVRLDGVSAVYAMAGRVSRSSILDRTMLAPAQRYHPKIANWPRAKPSVWSRRKIGRDNIDPPANRE